MMAGRATRLTGHSCGQDFLQISYVPASNRIVSSDGALPTQYIVVSSIHACSVWAWVAACHCHDSKEMLAPTSRIMEGVSLH